MEYALRFGFQASNNEAEYETIIVGLNLTHFMEANQLEICSDSQLVVKLIEDFYEAQGEKNDPVPQKGTRTAQNFYTGSGQVGPKGREYVGRCPRKTSNNTTGRSRQTDTGRAPPRTLGECRR